LYAATHSDVTTADNQVAVKFAPNDTTYSDTLPDSGMRYYRLYEKVFLPELQAFVLVGSNEVSTAAAGYPTVVSLAPSGTDAAPGAPLQVTFSHEMDHASVEQAFHVVSNISADSVSGTTSWSGNTFTFTPDPAWAYARTYSVQLGGHDLAGYALAASNPYTFKVKSGYRLDPDFASTDLGQSPADGALNGHHLRVASDGTAYIANDFAPIDVFDPSGAATGQIQFNGLVVVGTDGTLFGMEQGLPYTIDSIALNGSTQTVVSLQTQFPALQFFAVDQARSVTYLGEALQTFRYDLNSGAQIGDTIGGDFVTLDHQGRIYTSFERNMGLFGAYDPQGNALPDSPVVAETGALALAFDASDNAYRPTNFAKMTPQPVVDGFGIAKYDPSGRLLTWFATGNPDFGVQTQLFIPDNGAIYMLQPGAKVVRFLPDP
jgi:hypothetical protein